MREEEAVQKAALLPASEGKGMPKTAVDFDEPRIIDCCCDVGLLLAFSCPAGPPQIVHVSVAFYVDRENAFSFQT